MNYSSDELAGLAFRKAVFGGYSKKQVDDALAGIVEDYNHNRTEMNELEHRISALSETVQHYKSIEEAMQRCLVIAQHTSEEMKADAAEKAKTIVAGAEETAQKLVSDANQEANQIRLAYEEVKRKIFTFRTKSEALLNAQLDVLKQLSDS